MYVSNESVTKIIMLKLFYFIFHNIYNFSKICVKFYFRYPKVIIFSSVNL